MAFRLSSHSSGGPTPKFSVFHIWKAYDIIDRKGPIGRKALSKELGVGEGSTRTVIDKLLREGNIENTRKGAILTESGRKRFETFDIKVKRTEMGKLTIGPFDCAVQIRSMAHLIALGCDQRDEAVRAGAMGATTLVCKEGKLVFPDGGEHLDLELLSPIYDQFDICENDVFIIGSGSTYDDAEKGAVTAALALGVNSDQCWNIGTKIISTETKADDLKCLALAIHELVGRLPVAMRSRNNYGVRCEGGGIIDTDYTGPVLEEALIRNTIIRKVAPNGPFAGVPIIAVPIIRNREAVAAIAVVDISTAPIFKIMQKIKNQQQE